uniref:SdhD n=2 Tax=Gracilaria tenuistipitata TaxID=2510778 RepID=A0A2S1PUR8_GRATE|nr:SdhD [Gracilaria tenuistipitata]ARU07645.1 SdhD [Gracilaria tenuistipitata]AWH62574.1 SdhD [Gracilaria tenuistipitata]AWH62599.1 SdhD [Gracilaria tenuistipitata var. liui]AXI97783.1 succinate dehydrogenase subunit 4 [Gracilaria tenuistipitata]
MFDITWVLIRLAGFLFFFGLLLDIEIILLIVGLVLLHMNLGLNTILNDYIHFNKIKVFLTFLIRFSSIEIGRYILELLL